jgi:hypothetical protein
MRVFTSPEKKMEDLGAVRFAVEWWTIRPGADADEWEPDKDVVTHLVAAKTQAAAIRKAKTLAAKSCFGTASVQKQIVDWFVEEDRIAEWVNVGDSIEVEPHD